MSDTPVLVCTEGRRRGESYQVPTDGSLDIGRAPDNVIVLDDDGVSRYHARLLCDNGTVWLQDAGSRNGVFVNEQRLTQARALKVGDRIFIGEHVFQVAWDDDVASDEPEDVSDAPTHKRNWFWPFT